MKKLYLLFVCIPFFVLSNQKPVQSTIKEVIVYLSGAQITRAAACQIPSGISEIVLTGLSAKIDESSIQISGLQTVSILSMAYDINFMPMNADKTTSSPLSKRLKAITSEIAMLKNHISGLEEEEQVIYANRTVHSKTHGLNLERIKEIGTYYRERITAIKNDIFMANLKVEHLNDETRTLQKQLTEVNNTPEKEQGEIKIVFDAPVASNLHLSISYQVQDAGWIPNYDIKSKDINMPLTLGYKAHVYQKTGKDWNHVNVILSTANPNLNVTKPDLRTKHLNFTSGYQHLNRSVTKKKRYVYNPSVKKVTGTVLDEAGAPLPGANVMVKGTSNGTLTDFDGHFSLNVENGQELVVSYIGFHTTELPIYSSVLNVRLEEDVQVLDEVVVTGYGSKAQKNMTGSVAAVNTEQILTGRSSGIKIRGTSSLRQGNYSPPFPKPLYMIDGVPVEDFVEGDLDMNEIQSVEVLNDRSATALYGSRASNGVIVITTKRSTAQDNVTTTKFVIKKPYSIPSDGDITAIEINTFELNAKYEYYAVPIINENVFLTSTFTNWEQYDLLPGEATVYFKGTYAGKTTIDPYTTKKEMTISLGMDPNIAVTRKQNRNFKSKSFTGNNRILDRTYDLTVKNSKNTTIDLKLMDRIPMSQNKEIKVGNLVTNNADYDDKKGLLVWKMTLKPQESKSERFSFQVKYPRGRYISL